MGPQNVKQYLSRITWATLREYLYLLAGGLVQALSMRLFLIPAQLVSGGVSGAAQIINFFTAWWSSTSAAWQPKLSPKAAASSARS